MGLPASLPAQEPLSLSQAECRERALAHSEELQQAENALQQAGLDRKIANSASLPNFEGSALGAYMLPDIDMMGSELRMRGTYMAGISLTQPIYTGGKISSGRRLAKIGEAVASEQRRMTRMEVIAEADNAYWSYIAVERKVKMTEQYKTLMDTLFHQTETALKAGMATDNDLLRIEARRSEILYDLPEEESGTEEEVIPDYPVTVFFTREGYLKKIPPQSLRTAGAHKLKEGDEIIQQVETRNNVEALFFTDRQQVYKVRLNELEDGKVAQMGIFIPGRLGMDEGENVLAMVITSDYSGFMLFFFASGKCAKIPLNSYATKLNRRKLLKAYCDKETLAKMVFLPEETELAIRTSAGRMLLVGTAQISAKATRDSQGVAVVTLKKNQHIASVVPAETLELANPHRYRVRSLPATGALIRTEDEGEQLTLL